MSTSNREAKQALLAEWEHERDELNLLIGRLRKELGLGSSEGRRNDEPTVSAHVPSGTVNVDDLVQPGDFFGMTQPDAVKAFLARRPKNPASLQEIAAALYRGKVTDTLIGGTRLRNLSSTLCRAKDDFVSVAHGRWGLTEWYPNRVINKRAQKNEKDSEAEEKVVEIKQTA